MEIEKDLYEILGIKKDATEEQIKKAYRDKSMEFHPDKGGNPDDFKELKFAYDILKDKEKRYEYDRTGMADPDERKESATEILQTLFTDIIFGAGAEELLRADIIGYARQKVTENQVKLRADIPIGQRKLKILQKVKSKIKHNSESPNILENIVTKEIENTMFELKNIRTKMALNGEVINLLKDYEYDIESK